MALRVKKITDKIILISADSREELAVTFMRFQEHYESPEFRGTVFTVGAFRKWYAETYGAFTYASDWSGFNIPGTVLEPFRQGLFDPLTEREEKLLDLFRDRRDDFYVIGANTDDVLEHEICHGLYHTEPGYRRAVDRALADHRGSLAGITSHLLRIGYHKGVMADEIHAYVSCDYDYITAKGILVPRALHMRLRAIRKKFPTA